MCVYGGMLHTRNESNNNNVFYIRPYIVTYQIAFFSFLISFSVELLAIAKIYTKANTLKKPDP